MLEKTTRDAALVPAMEGPRDAMLAWFEAAGEVVARGRPERGAQRRRVRAAIGHALSFETWRSLVRAQRLSEAEAVALMAGLAESVGRPPGRSTPSQRSP